MKPLRALKDKIAGRVEGVKAQVSGSKGESCPWPLPPQGIDLVLLMTVGAMVVFGLLMVYSSSYIFAQEKTGDGFSFIKKQMLYALVGFGGLFGICRIDYRNWFKWAYPFLGVSIGLLIMVLIPGVGTKVLGAQRWIRLGPFGFQPGELAKFAVIVFASSQLARKSDRIHTVAAGIVSPFLVPLPAMLLLLMQPDFGTTVMITVVMFTLMFLAGVPKRFLGGIILLGATVGSWLALSSPYRRARVMTYLDPWKDPGGKGFQILQSLTGIHNGHFWGVGLGNGKEKLFYLPEAHNDFIFAVIGEELGFVGIVVVVVAFLYLIYRGLNIAFNCQKQYQDRFGMLLASGITLALGLQGFVNMAVVMGLLPTKGLTLPFISYGGSALMIDLFAVGVLLSVARGPRK
ncbi:MAG: putative lipid II flippase FtsW [Bdellovibrionia bacterium]